MEEKWSSFLVLLPLKRCLNEFKALFTRVNTGPLADDFGLGSELKDLSGVVSFN